MTTSPPTDASSGTRRAHDAPAISVIIVNYNAGPRLARCLSALAAQTFTDFEAIVIDNGSEDGSLTQARSAAPWASFIEAGENLGFALGNNRACQTARGTWLAFLNPDAYARPDWLERLMAATRRHGDVDAFGSTQIEAANPDRLDGAGDVLFVLGVPYRGHLGWPIESLPPESECFAPCAAAALYRASAFWSVGGFDERFFCYCEDVDLGFRLRLAGMRAVQVPDAIVDHEGSAISGRASAFTVYHGNRNRIWLMYKNMPGAIYWPMWPLRLAANAVFLARAFARGVGPTYWRALRDGYAGLSQLRAVRRQTQADRRANTCDIARALTWSPLRLIRRAADPRPVRRRSSGTDERAA